MKLISTKWLGASLLIALSLAQCSVALGQGLSSISGKVVQDLNGNCRWDRGEGVSAGTSVYIEREGGGFQDYVQTDSNGAFRINELVEGRYRITPGAGEGGVITFPTPAGYTITLPRQSGLEVRFGVHKQCFKVLDPGFDVQETGESGCFRVRAKWVNLTGKPISELYFTQGAAFQVYPTSNPSSLNQVSFNPPIAAGGTIELDVLVCGVEPGQCINFPLLATNPQRELCCETMIKNICMPEDRCLEVVESVAICRSQGGFDWTFCFKNRSGQTANKVVFGSIRDIAGNVVGYVSPNQINGNVYPNSTYCYNLILAGPKDGTQVFIDVLLYQSGRLCCFERIPIVLPDCQRCTILAGRNRSIKPRYQDPALNAFPGSVLAVTCGNGFPPGDQGYVLSYLNMANYQTVPPPFGNNINTTANPLGMYHGPDDPATTAPDGVWKQKYMGTVFGLTIDDQGATYVTHTSIYPVVSAGVRSASEPSPGTPRKFGQVLKVDPATGQMSEFACLPQSTVRPGLGNITFDYDNRQFFVTNFEDGLIYRIPMAGRPQTFNWAASPINTDWFRPGYVAATVTPALSSNNVGHPVLGQRTFGIQYHRGRLYYARWSEQLYMQSSLMENEIWSVGIDATGKFLSGTERKEPGKPQGVFGTANPVADISFSPEGYMGLSEITMNQLGGSTKKWSHYSRVVEARCVNNVWAPRVDTTGLTIGQTVFKTGPTSVLGWPGYENSYTYDSYANSQGGLDYDFFGGTNQNSGRRVWATAAWSNNDFAPFNGNYLESSYGLTGFLPAGGNSFLEAPTANTIIIDYDNIGGGPDKNYFGDVEIPNN